MREGVEALTHIGGCAEPVPFRVVRAGERVRGSGTGRASAGVIADVLSSFQGIVGADRHSRDRAKQ
jgi:hypothetical protein